MIRPAFLALSGHAASAVAATLAMVLYGRLLPETDFGLYSTAFAVTTFGTVICAGGLPDLLLRSASHEQGAARSAARSLAGAAAGSTGAALLFTTLILAVLLYQRPILLLLATSVLLMTPTLLVAAICRIEDRFVLVAMTLPIPNAVRFGVALAATIAPLDLTGICIVTSIANVSLAIVMALVLLWPTQTRSHTAFTAPLRTASPYLGANALSAAAKALPVPILNAVMGAGAAAVFTTASLLPRRSSLIGNAVADTAGLPRLMRAAAESHADFVGEARRLVMRLALLGMLVAIAIALLGIPVLWYMRYTDAMPLLFLLSLLIPIQFVNLAMSAILKHASTAHGRTGDLSVSLAVTAATLALFVPAFGIAGAVMAVAAAELVLLLRYSIRFRRFAITPP